jgi:uncharacterized DUF497 family protein
VQFEYDPDKSVANLLKHGIDFEEAKELWNNVTVTIPSTSELEEPRWLVIGTIQGKHWTAVIADRNPATRLISLRRSRKEERQLYEKNCKNYSEGT